MEIDNDTLSCLRTFEDITKTVANDCVISTDRLIFVVSEGQLGKAIGKNGATIEKVRRAFKGKKIVAVEDAKQMDQYVRNLFQNINILKIETIEEPNKNLQIVIDSKDRGMAIGRSGDKIKTNRMLIQRKYGYDLKLKTINEFINKGEIIG